MTALVIIITGVYDDRIPTEITLGEGDISWVSGDQDTGYTAIDNPGEIAGAFDKIGVTGGAGEFLFQVVVDTGGGSKTAQAPCLVRSCPEDHRGPTEPGDHFCQGLVHGKTGDQPGPQPGRLDRDYQNLVAPAVNGPQ